MKQYKWSFHKERLINHRRGIILGIDTITCFIEPKSRESDDFYFGVCNEVFGGLYYDGSARSLEESKHYLRCWLNQNADIVNDTIQQGLKKKANDSLR